jgi:hypothetical protein
VDPHRRHPGYPPRPAAPEGLAPSTSEPMTTPSTRSGRGPGCRQGSVAQPLHHHGLDPPCAPCHGRGLGRHRRSPVADGGAGSTRRRGKCSWTGSRSSRPSATAAATTAQGRAGGTRGWPRARLDPAARPAIALRLGPAASRSAITRTDLTDLTRLSLQPSTWRVPVGGCVVGWVGRSGGPCWCRLGQRDGWLWQR